ncbi:MAG: phosphoglycerate kinase [Patescibacteria group bacterium]
MKKIQDTDISNKKVLVRVDYNVPMDGGTITDDERIKASLETINYLLSKNNSVIICSHLGRPEGRPNILFSLKPIVNELEMLIKKSVQFSDSCVGAERDRKIQNLKTGEILLLENVRFCTGEETNDPTFASDLAKGCDVYINDAFSASHREHASIVGVAKIIDSYAGFCLQKEVENLSKILIEPKRPLALVLGGAKISDKIDLLDNLIDKIDTLILGGAIANTFLLAKGLMMEKSVVEVSSVEVVKEILKNTNDRNVDVFLPEDVLVGKSVDDNIAVDKQSSQLVANEMILDIGESTIMQNSNGLQFAETIFWNGPMGYTENPIFRNGTIATAKAIISSSAFSVVGGGDTIAALPGNMKEQFGYVSMAGGASLEFLSGKTLPGVKVLE